jgi:SAM-dependent methyltransferase
LYVGAASTTAKLCDLTMDPAEYANLDRVEQQHWYYQGKRAIVRHWIDRHRPLSTSDFLVDVGCGTGAFLVEMSGRCRVQGVDDHAESIAIARSRVEAVGGQVLQSSLDRVELPDGVAQVVTALDVLEHLDDDAASVRELCRLLAPGGLLVVTVPSLRILWSDWDVALHHRRRYHRGELRQLLAAPELELLRCTYFNSLVFPAVLGIRWWRKLMPPRAGARRAEDRVPPSWLNRLLYRTMVDPACWNWWRPPVGVSLLAVARRR